MKSQELKKKEKGKEIVTSEENPTASEVSMYFSEQGIAALPEASEKDNADKVGVQQKKTSSSKITPCIFYTSDEKARLRWSSDLHDCFVKAVDKLGGLDKATPKAVKDMMEVEGIALHHVKSHLQKFRLGRCNIRDETDQYHTRYRTGRRLLKADAASNSPRPQVNIRPKVMGDVKPKKVTDDHGSLYMLIEHDLNLQRCREAERMQMAFEIENNRKMLEAQYLQASKAQETSNTCSMYEPQHVSTSVIHSTLGKPQFNSSHNYNMAQSFIHPYVTTAPQSIPGSFTITTKPEIQLKNDCLIHDSYRNPNFLTQTGDSLHQGTPNNTFPSLTAPEPVQTYVPSHTYNYPEYNTLERVKAQLSALQNSSTSRIQAMTSREPSLSSSVTRNDEEDPVDMYIDWGKYEEVD